MQKPKVWNKVSMALAVALTGGTLFGTCELRLRDALITGSKSALLGLLDPSNFENLGATGGGTTGGDEGENGNGGNAGN